MARKKKAKPEITVSGSASGMFTGVVRQPNIIPRDWLDEIPVRSGTLAQQTVQARGSAAVNVADCNAEMRYGSSPAVAALSVQSLENARRIMELNANPEMFDRTAVMSEMHRYEIRHREAERERVRRADTVRVEVSDRPDHYGLEIVARVQPLSHGHLIDTRQIQQDIERGRPHDAWMREAAARIATQLTVRLEEQIYHGILDATRVAPQRHVYEAGRHAHDMIRGFFGGRHARPETPTVIKDIGNYPNEIRCGPFVATLLADDVMIWDEGERMGHCLGKAYTDDILCGKYLCYHVDRPGSRNGTTLGFKRPRSWAGDAVKTWVFDQNKGKANSVPKERALTDFCTYVENVLNGMVQTTLQTEPMS